MLAEGVTAEKRDVVPEARVELRGQTIERFGARFVNPLESCRQEQIHVSLVRVQRKSLECTKPIDELSVSHRVGPQTPACRRDEQLSLCRGAKKLGRRPSVETVAHLLPGKWHPAVYALENIEKGFRWDLRINDIQNQIAVLRYDFGALERGHQTASYAVPVALEASIASRS